MQRIVKRTLAVGLGLGLVVSMAGCSTAASNWHFTDSQGEVRELSDYKGQIVVINFSNTWCEPCQDAADLMQDLQEQFGRHNVKVMMISSWERGDPQKWMHDRGYTYGVMLHGTKIARQYEIDQLPSFVVVGVDGRVIYRHDGLSKSTPAKITKVVEKHLRKHSKTYAQHSG